MEPRSQPSVEIRGRARREGRQEKGVPEGHRDGGACFTEEVASS